MKASGWLYAAAAGLLWGLVFVTPLLLPDYPPLWLTAGRYLAFGLVALPLALLDVQALRRLTRADWLHAVALSAVGNFLYYLLLSGAIQHAGGALPTMIIGTLPLAIALSANWRNAARDGRYRLRQLAAPLGLIALGLAAVHHAEYAALRPERVGAYALGALLALGAVACWTWYPLRNADWLRQHPGRSPRSWASAQGLVTLPMALLLLVAAPWLAPLPGPGALGPQPWAYAGLMLALGLLASWLGTLCWNAASQRLPTALVGQLIVFETLAALLYVLLLRQHGPAPGVLLGAAALLLGVVLALRQRPQAPAKP
ncbi:EamA family transporter [Roseateles sp. BYS180W]|uniref:EamA family transporter n=1 Tax=Roseateles rivi TaxID=3299028 RepID=A0ABW7FQQ2_9BURK